jgi:hypothetical protein
MPKIQSTRLFSAVLVILGVAHFARAASPPQPVEVKGGFGCVTFSDYWNAIGTYCSLRNRVLNIVTARFSADYFVHSAGQRLQGKAGPVNTHAAERASIVEHQNVAARQCFSKRQPEAPQVHLRQHLACVPCLYPTID